MTIKTRPVSYRLGHRFSGRNFALISYPFAISLKPYGCIQLLFFSFFLFHHPSSFPAFVLHEFSPLQRNIYISSRWNVSMIPGKINEPWLRGNIIFGIMNTDRWTMGILFDFYCLSNDRLIIFLPFFVHYSCYYYFYRLVLFRQRLVN